MLDANGEGDFAVGEADGDDGGVAADLAGGAHA